MISSLKKIQLSNLIEKANTGADAIKRAPIVEIDTGIRCLRIGDISNNRLYEEWGFTEATDDVIKKFLLKKDDVIVARTGNTIGVVKYIDRDINSVYNNGLIRLKTKKEFNAKYVYYNLISEDFKRFIYGISAGTSTQPNMKIDQMLQYEVTNYTREEQDRIVNILSSLDKKIELNNEMNKTLEEIAQALFKRWFVDFEFPNEDGEPYKSSGGEMVESELGMIPKECKVFELDNCCSLIAKGITPKYTEFSEQIVINQKCIRDGKINLKLARYHIPKKINEKWLKRGDILINSTGQGTLGRIAQVIEEPINLVVDSHITIVRPDSELLIYYLGCLLSTKQYLFESMASGSTGQTDLPRALVKAMKIIIPSNDVLVNFTKLIKPIRDKMIMLQKENIDLEEIRDSLLPKLMNGEIRVEDIEANL